MLEGDNAPRPCSSYQYNIITFLRVATPDRSNSRKSRKVCFSPNLSFTNQLLRINTGMKKYGLSIF